MELTGNFETVDSLPCLKSPVLDALVLSDIHIGIEIVQTSSGIYMPRVQTKSILEELKNAKEEAEVGNIIVNGDVKHSFTGRNSKENEELEGFLQNLSMMFEDVYLVKGNHDTALEHRTEDFKNVHVYEELVEDGYMFVHGHEKFDIPENVETVVIGHEHPALELKDKVGVKEKISCFLHGEIDEVNVIVLPAYSELASGTSINNIPKEKLLTPFLRKRGIKELKAVGIDREGGLFKFPEIGRL